MSITIRLVWRPREKKTLIDSNELFLVNIQKYKQDYDAMKLFTFYMKDGFYESNGTCKQCNCLKEGSRSDTCDKKTGQCSCLPNIIGSKCDRCLGIWQDITKGCRGMNLILWLLCNQASPYPKFSDSCQIFLKKFCQL